MPKPRRTEVPSLGQGEKGAWVLQGDDRDLQSILQQSTGQAGPLLGEHTRSSFPFQPQHTDGCFSSLAVKGIMSHAEQAHCIFSISCSWLRVWQATCLRRSQIATESRLPSTQVSLEVTSPFQHRVVVAAARCATALPDSVNCCDEVILHTCCLLLLFSLSPDSGFSSSCSPLISLVTNNQSDKICPGSFFFYSFNGIALV